MKSLKLLSAAILASTALVGTTSVFAADAAVEPVAGLVKQGSMKALPVPAAPVEAAPAAGAAGGAAVGGAGLAQPAAEADAEVATIDAARDRYFATGKLMRAESAAHLLGKSGEQSVKDALAARKAAVADKIGADITTLGARPADIKLEPVVVTEADVIAALGNMRDKTAPVIQFNPAGEIEYKTRAGKALEDTEMAPSAQKGKLSSFTVADIKKALDTAKSGKKPDNQAAHDEAVAAQALYDVKHKALEAARDTAAGINVETEFAALTDKKPVAHKVLAELAAGNGFVIDKKAVDTEDTLVEFFASLAGKQAVLDFLKASVKAQIDEAVKAAKPTINADWVGENFDALEDAGLTYASNMDVLKRKIAELSTRPAGSGSVSRASSVASTATGASGEESLADFTKRAEAATAALRAQQAAAAAAAADALKAQQAAASGGAGTGGSLPADGVPVAAVAGGSTSHGGSASSDHGATAGGSGATTKTLKSGLVERDGLIFDNYDVYQGEASESRFYE